MIAILINLMVMDVIIFLLLFLVVLKFSIRCKLIILEKKVRLKEPFSRREISFLYDIFNIKSLVSKSIKRNNRLQKLQCNLIKALRDYKLKNNLLNYLTISAREKIRHKICNNLY